MWFTGYILSCSHPLELGRRWLGETKHVATGRRFRGKHASNVCMCLLKVIWHDSVGIVRACWYFALNEQ